MKLAITHEWLVHPGGSEKVVEAFHEIFPDAALYTLVYNKNSMPPQFSEMDIRTTFLQSFAAARKNYQPFLPFMPTAFKSLDLKGYDVVLSSSHACAKMLSLSSSTLHICYCYTPMRYVWDFYEIYKNRLNPVKRKLFSLAAAYLRREDIISAQTVHHFIAISNHVKKRIQRTYDRDSDVIYPPVNTEYFVPDNQKKQTDEFLIVSRLVPYKKIHIAVEAFNALGLPLRVIGEGQDLDTLKKIAKPNIVFTGRLPDEDVLHAYQTCRALIFPQEEDFGIAALEAQACGKPVIAYKDGGALDTVIEGKTGLFFKPQAPAALVESVNLFQNLTFHPDEIRKHALSFSMGVFKSQISDYIMKKWENFKKK